MADFRSMLESGRCSDIGCGQTKICMCALADDMADEIERLSLLVAEDTGAWQDLWKKSEAENERLRAGLKEIAELHDVRCDEAPGMAGRTLREKTR